MNETEIKLYETICRNDGIKVREIARLTGVEKTELNRLLYNAPFIHELCYRDKDYHWNGLIRQTRPHYGLQDFCGYYDIHDGSTDAAKEALIKKVNAGKIKVLIGSTMKLGTGVNVQENLIAIHHLDIPWRPSDMVQRNGRLIRSGNKNPEFYVSQRRTWNGLNPVTRSVPNGKGYDRSRMKQEYRRNSREYHNDGKPAVFFVQMVSCR